MVTYLYLLIAALVLFVICYLIKKARCDSDTIRYLVDTPIDPNTYDDGKCQKEVVARVEATEIKPDELLNAPRDGKDTEFSKRVDKGEVSSSKK